jgi:hypothetical protein
MPTYSQLSKLQALTPTPPSTFLKASSSITMSARTNRLVHSSARMDFQVRMEDLNDIDGRGDWIDCPPTTPSPKRRKDTVKVRPLSVPGWFTVKMRVKVLASMYPRGTGRRRRRRRVDMAGLLDPEGQLEVANLLRAHNPLQVVMLQEVITLLIGAKLLLEVTNLLRVTRFMEVNVRPGAAMSRKVAILLGGAVANTRMRLAVQVVLFM